jgi:hypothetical protein
VWLNGKGVLSRNVTRACAPDQERVTLDLKAGKNDLLMKVTQGGGEWAFYFQPLAKLPPAISWNFDDASDAAGLGERGVGGKEKGDALAVCDIDGDGRPDFVYGAGVVVVARNEGGRFVEAAANGLRFDAGRVGPVFGDYNADGRPDLAVPRRDGVRLFRNDGGFQFTEVPLPKVVGAACAAWGDVDNDGQLDLVVGCLRGPNRFLRNKGNGAFEDASERLGLTRQVFNTQAVGLVDLNGDGALDFVFNNEGQDACVLLGNPDALAKRTPVSLLLAAKSGVVGGRVVVRDTDGRLLASQHVSGGDGRGGQAPLMARFALPPGRYRLEWLASSGEKRGQPLLVESSHVRATLDEKTPKME